MKYLLYCLFEKPRDLVVSMYEHPAESQVQVMERQGLCAAYSEIPHAEAAYGTAEFMHFHKVIESFFDQVNLVPFRFGTVLDEKADLERLLENRSVHYREILLKLEGCVEMGIRAIIDESKNPPAGNDCPSGFPSQDTPNPGQSYLSRRKAHFFAELSQTDANNQAIERFRVAFADMFRGFRSEVSRVAPQPEKPGALLLSLYFLVPKEFLGRFRQGFTALASEQSSKLLLSGPWPPYNFVLPGDPHARQS
jgi:hypothetical protein